MWHGDGILDLYFPPRLTGMNADPAQVQSVPELLNKLTALITCQPPEDSRGKMSSKALSIIQKYRSPMLEAFLSAQARSQFGCTFRVHMKW